MPWLHPPNHGPTSHILATLWLRGPLTVGQLQAQLALGSSTLTGAIDRMEKLGLVARKPVPGDRRAFLLAPVEWPVKKREALLTKLEQTESECFAELSAAERRELARLLAKALLSIERVDDVDDGD